MKYLFLFLIPTCFLFTKNVEQVEDVTKTVVLDSTNGKCQLFDKAEIWYYLDSFCLKYSLNADFVFDIGQNESGWKNDNDTSYIRLCGIKGEKSYGDLQLNITLLKHYNRVNDTTSRINLLELGIKHLSIIYNKNNSYYKTRFIYGRGHWRNESTWTSLEQHFMNNMNWNNY